MPFASAEEKWQKKKNWKKANPEKVWEQTRRWRERRKQKQRVLNPMLWVKAKNWNLLEVAVERKKAQVVKEKLEELKEKGRRRQAVTDRNSEEPPCSQRR